MTKERQALIDRFQKWLDTNPRKQIIAAQCATIAEEYHSEQLLIHSVVVSLFCECTIPNLNYGKGQSKECNRCGKLPK